MNNNDFLLLVSKRLSGEATEAELNELEAVLNSDADHALQFKIQQQYWEEHESLNQQDVEASLQKLLGRLELPATEPAVETAPKTRRIFGYSRLSVAAAASIIAIV